MVRVRLGPTPEISRQGKDGAAMNMEEEEFSPYAAFSSGCDIHGEDYLRECTMCGIEFCSACFPQSTLCSDCAAQGDLVEEEEKVLTDEEKELLLLEGIGEEEATSEADLPAAPPAKKSGAGPLAKGKAKAAPKAIAKASKPAKSGPKAKSKGKTKAASTAKAKPQKPAKPTSKTQAKAKAKKKR
jgi:hypothetical protein